MLFCVGVLVVFCFKLVFWMVFFDDLFILFLLYIYIYQYVYVVFVRKQTSISLTMGLFIPLSFFVRAQSRNTCWAPMW